MNLSITSFISVKEKTYFKSLGKKISKIRQKRGLTQSELAQKTGVTQQVIASYEVGRRKIPVSILPLISKILSVPIDEILATKKIKHPRRKQRGI